MPKSQSKPKTGLARLIEIAGAKKWWLFASMALAVLATMVQFVPTIIVYQIIQELGGLPGASQVPLARRITNEVSGVSTLRERGHAVGPAGSGAVPGRGRAAQLDRWAANSVRF